jgi:S-DNA-T family DNA segregation ATPase FtsK/SpoIIIE
MMLADTMKKSKGKLTVALGLDVGGNPLVADLTKMPHVLVAGTTGSGKSVLVNVWIATLLFRTTPQDVRLIMIDPKRVELTTYNGIPHLLTPVITDPAKTVNALRWTINEMDRRLRLLEKHGKKDIVSFNAVAKQRLPYIVFIIDELADLMMLAGKEVEPGIVRIAQMARAVGIHLILATQRPSVNVITGLIKANMPARIAFAVASGIDSRTILDTPGAEKLIGKGDMLFSSASMPTPKRIQGSFISEKEIKKIVSEIKRQSGGPLYVDGIIEKQKVYRIFPNRRRLLLH